MFINGKNDGLNMVVGSLLVSDDRRVRQIYKNDDFAEENSGILSHFAERLVGFPHNNVTYVFQHLQMDDPYNKQ